MRIASLDLGTNSFLCLITQVSSVENIFQKGEEPRILLDELKIVRLGEGVDQNKKFSEDALKRADECLGDFAQKIRRFECQSIRAVATSAARDALNKNELILIAARHGIPVQIIPGDEEARLTYLGTFGPDHKSENMSHDRLVIDIGGGSTEYIKSTPGGLYSQSLDIGSVRLTERFIHSDPPDHLSLQQLRSHIKNELNNTLCPQHMAEIKAVAGTPTSLACAIQGIDYQESKVHDFILSKNVIQDWVLKFSEMTIEQKQKIPGIGKRADIILVGAMILEESLNFFEVETVKVSTRGLRFGLAYESMMEILNPSGHQQQAKVK